jgi:hypothetical protein
VPNGVIYVGAWFEQVTKPARTNQVMITLTDLKRRKRELIAENMFWRQQLIVLERQVDRPNIRNAIGGFWCCWRARYEPGGRHWSS